jgi:AcrR family transcriptional regulator
MTTTRRERLRAELVDNIKDAALAQLEAGGPSAVSLRGIAREIGVSPAAIYGYFDSLDDLFTALITDGFDDHADAIEAAVDAQAGAPIATRMLQGLLAYRRFALENAARFRLCYFAPIPGYEAPEDAPSMTAALRVTVPFLRILAEGWASGELEPQPPGPVVDTSKFEDRFGLALTSDQLRSATECWGEFHGLVALEMSGAIHEKWTDPGELYEANMRAMVSRMGMTAPTEPHSRF